ncbi:MULTISPECIES: type II 3-dehydroquinate dehydratase [unclassified Dehalobacter]|jgi:3-dehydroquinate dehydratase, type II|uniref:type II 3-dehydroquinate dehydratase n=1 Tax=unclassified Dehalobacter TaxID=2635733 RepID=UPI00028AFF12|nr:MULTISPECIES: type II 3-dehydroquinate dehydratase [unclassified Dehalobacter]AFV01464.1 3-dehydroquinate dehydratase II [Dehalobacter sp. DCA]AFV04501.1 3-dehydroquinate dehydratase II [Dehalobacter sp. CF]EQB20591.1 3-dehydroquinate dehydratase II [Dehalobacter sp. UNSWDHB]MDJ0304993.1 3-dehydroquinate dehydratase [Dehalobacter sp.]
MNRIHVFHGVNLHLLGQREPDIYGRITLDEVNGRLIETGQTHGFTVECRQTNYEGELVDWITKLTPVDFLILNPGAWTHTSYALYDAIKGVSVPALEVHLSNIYARESFRSHSVIAGACVGQISGLGTDSYFLALAYALEFQKYRQKERNSNHEAGKDSPETGRE